MLLCRSNGTAACSVTPPAAPWLPPKPAAIGTGSRTAPSQTALTPAPSLSTWCLHPAQKPLPFSPSQKIGGRQRLATRVQACAAVCYCTPLFGQALIHARCDFLLLPCSSQCRLEWVKATLLWFLLSQFNNSVASSNGAYASLEPTAYAHRVRRLQITFMRANVQ